MSRIILKKHGFLKLHFTCYFFHRRVFGGSILSTAFHHMTIDSVWIQGTIDSSVKATRGMGRGRSSGLVGCLETRFQKDSPNGGEKW